MNFIDVVAKRKAKTEGWLPCIYEFIGDDAFLIFGGVPIGNRKNGRPKWGPRKSLDRVIVTNYEIEFEEKSYERDTGKCSKCLGEGKTVASISVNQPTTYRPCSKCGGTGKPGA